nr:MAG: hypothetical protein KatS3mg041_1193 [Bacteroidota bacterium]
MTRPEELHTAIALLEAEHYQEALPLWKAALERDPHDPVALWGCGICLEQLGQLQEAVRVYEALLGSEALEARFRVAILNNLGLCYFRLGRYEEARSCFASALPEDPSACSGRHLAMTLIELGAYTEGVDQLVRTLRHHPQDVPALLLLAGYLEEVGAFDRAATYYEWARDVIRANSPEHPDLRFIEARIEGLAIHRQSTGERT